MSSAFDALLTLHWIEIASSCSRCSVDLSNHMPVYRAIVALDHRLANALLGDGYHGCCREHEDDSSCWTR